MFSITREQFIEAALAETERLRTLARAVGKREDSDQEQVNWWMTRIANIQFAIEHLSGDAYIGILPPTEMRALMEILYG